MDAKRLFGVVRKWAWLILLLGVTVAVTAGAVSYQRPRVYQSAAVALVNPNQAVVPNQQGFINNDELVQTYVRMTGVAPVKEALVRAGNITPEQASTVTISATRDPGTDLVDIFVQSPDAAVSLAGARGVVPAFNSSLDQLQREVQGTGTATRLQALVPVFTPTDAPTTPISPQPVRDALIALVIGLALGTALAFGLERIDTTIKTDVDVREQLDLPLLGSLVFRADGGRSAANGSLALLTLHEPNDPLAEAYRAIRTSLVYQGVDQALSRVVVTSSVPGEGKTVVACNLAASLALAGSRVILVDADFRRPDLHNVFGLVNRGLGDLILKDGDEAELIQLTGWENLSVVTSGPTPLNPAELLGSSSMAQVMDRLEELADIVVYDTPPVGAVTDATVLGTNADGVVLVVEHGRPSVGQIKRARDTLQNVDVRILGVVLNKLPAAEAGEYYGDYYGPDIKPTRRRDNKPAHPRGGAANGHAAPAPARLAASKPPSASAPQGAAKRPKRVSKDAG